MNIMQENNMRERYKRQIMLPEIGIQGQKILTYGKVLVVGAGGLGTPCCAYLAGMGVGTIRIADPDSIALSNLPRQIMYDMNDISKLKANTLSKKLSAANPTVKIIPLECKVTEENAIDLISQHDVVVSCVDNIQTRHAINRAAVACGKPLVDGGINGFQVLLPWLIRDRALATLYLSPIVY